MALYIVTYGLFWFKLYFKLDKQDNVWNTEIYQLQES